MEDLLSPLSQSRGKRTLRGTKDRWWQMPSEEEAESQSLLRRRKGYQAAQLKPEKNA